MVNLTGGYGAALREAISVLQTPHPDRFVVFTEPAYSKAASPDHAKYQADQIEVAHKDGARGLKVLKILGLYLREQNTQGKLVKVDDPRFDLMREAAARRRCRWGSTLRIRLLFSNPSTASTSGGKNCTIIPTGHSTVRIFRPTANCRKRAAASCTHFVCLHCAESEDLADVSECLDSHPNMYVDIAARIGELGRQPRASRKFFDKYQGRIVFGTGATPKATNFPQQVFEESLDEIYYRFLEREDEYFDYSTAKVPPQGQWRIFGLGLSDAVLHKVYWQNAARLLNL